MQIEQEVEMKYGVLYCVDVPHTVDIDGFLPSDKQPFKVTEGDEQYDYDYLEGDWEEGFHRKLVGVLTQKQFDSFVDELGLFAEDVETGGSLGVPWSDYLVAPAISFISESADAVQRAYVTPLPQCDALDDPNEEGRLWRSLRKKIIERYKP